MYSSTKVIDGFSTCFRQWRADGTHCKFLHGYSIKFEVEFEGELDERNWVVDFGFLKRYKISPEKDSLTVRGYFEYLFDHTVVISETDPELEKFKELDKSGVIQLRILKEVGCELFAELVFNVLNDFIESTPGLAKRVKIKHVICYEHEKNSAKFSK